MNNITPIILATAIIGAGGYFLLKKKEEDGPSEGAKLPNVVLNPDGSGAIFAGNNNTQNTPVTLSSRNMSIITRLRNGTQTWFANDLRCTAYEDYFNTNTADFLDIWNYYKNQYGVTIREDMDNTNASGCLIFTTQWDEKLYDRFDALGI